MKLALSSMAVAVSAALVVPAAQADTLSDLRSKQATARANQKNIKSDVAASQAGLSAAIQELESSQAQLDEARAALADLQVELVAARERDAELARELAQAQAALAAAKARVVEGEADVARQQEVIVGAVTESYQQRTDLTGLSVVFDAGSTAQLGQRLQWNTTIFDTQAAEKSRLDEILARLQQDRDRAAALEEQVSQAKAESEANVQHIAGLEAAAEAQRQAVATLVQANEQARTAAEADLAADEAAYRALVNEEDKLQREIEGEIARLKAEEERARKAAEAKAAAERAAAAKAAADKKAAAASAASDKSANTTTNKGKKKSGSVSSAGFIRPINASPGSKFGRRFHPILKYWRMHNGNDWGARIGTPIYAAASGTVLKAGRNGGFGNFVMIGHGSIIQGKYVTTGYAHQSRIVVRRGQKVKRGQLIGYVGNTGLSTTPHLHLELRLDGRPVNPMRYIP
ncbi:MAG: peptidoglycan DD-metalloendopeptidase family protein [Propioniciclava sp.]